MLVVFTVSQQSGEEIQGIDERLNTAEITFRATYEGVCKFFPYILQPTAT